MTVTDVTDEAAPPEPAFDAPRPIEDMSLEELLDRPIDGAPPPTAEAAGSDPAEDDAARPADERPDHGEPDDEDDEPEARDRGGSFLRP